jgi:hypothetical protein
MIGSQRTTVSEVARGLQDRGLIEYARGSIKILDRVGLENASCECYPITRNLLADVYKLANQTVLRMLQHNSQCPVSICCIEEIRCSHVLHMNLLDQITISG